ncbi:hypothetical protein [Micromonospora haikouensis]|uniref:AAA+ ATPase domain-containing protein n=1 Tax=Micromonospora haikouensis TaxID=686309 RepID=A0A0D0X160_9ACTN|nr:hypothetical protein [Micromonospora haikouensis]KIR64604.1 hypothetical protein TK50_02860 [Micromonospora haikouensis]
MIVDQVAGVPQAFRDFLDQRGLVYDARTQIDLLAASLGAQFLLFAGPSGTGKSTAARVLSDFFSQSRCHAVIDTRPAWTSSEDLVGQYSVFAGAFVNGPVTQDLMRLHENSSGTPVITVEEANLSPMEAYLGPVITAASAIAFESLRWPLHHHGTNAGGVPTKVQLHRFPRVFGTVNVDSTAQAPAPKVSGRACVVLLEPPDIDYVLRSTDAIVPPPPRSIEPPGAALFGDPTLAWSSYLTMGDSDRFAAALRPLLTVVAEEAGRGTNIVSPRDIQRCVLYMAWHVPLAEAALAGGLLPGHTDMESAENSLLHFVLPGLSSEQFGRVLPSLLAATTEGGLLYRRLTKLAAGGESLFGVSPDFWASLS